METQQLELQRTILQQALSERTAETDSLSQDDFSATTPEHPEWAIGPFRLDPTMTFRQEGYSVDPLNIGWTSSSLFNPSLAADGDDLIMFYRASPRKESLGSRIGLARLKRGTDNTVLQPVPHAQPWDDQGVILWPDANDELYGCEDPKIYRLGTRWFLFYNGVFPVTERERRDFPSTGYPVGAVGCTIKLAVSDDLVHWQKCGSIIDPDVSRLWAKGAVIVRDPGGTPLQVNGHYIMYVSEGCNGILMVGVSKDLIHWSWHDEPYLDLSSLDGSLHEVACAVAGHHNNDLILDFFYADEHGAPAAAQALYRTTEPFTQRALSRGGTLSWGGVIADNGNWLIAQGWDAPPGEKEIYFYRSTTSCRWPI